MKKRLFLAFLAISSIFVSYGYAGLEILETDDDDYEVDGFEPDKPFQEVLEQDLNGDEKDLIISVRISREWVDLGSVFRELPNLERLHLRYCSITISSYESLVLNGPRIFCEGKSSLAGNDWRVLFKKNRFCFYIDGTCLFELMPVIDQARAFSKEVRSPFVVTDEFFRETKSAITMGYSVGSYIRKFFGLFAAHDDYDVPGFRIRKMGGRICFSIMDEDRLISLIRIPVDQI